MAERAEEQKCAGTTSDRWPRPCPRKATVEVDGRMYCTAHAAGRKRSKAAKDAADARYRERKERGDRVQARASELSRLLGTKVTTHYRGFEGGYDERCFLVPAEWLTLLAERTPAAGNPPPPESEEADA